MPRRKKVENSAFKNEFSYAEMLQKENNKSDIIVIDGTEYTLDEIRSLIKATLTKKNPVEILNAELPIIKERFANILQTENIKVLSAIENKNVVYGLITDGQKMVVIKRFQNGFIGLVKGVYSSEVFMGLLKNLTK